MHDIKTEGKLLGRTEIRKEQERGAMYSGIYVQMCHNGTLIWMLSSNKTTSSG